MQKVRHIKCTSNVYWTNCFCAQCFICFEAGTRLAHSADDNSWSVSLQLIWNSKTIAIIKLSQGYNNITLTKKLTGFFIKNLMFLIEILMEAWTIFAIQDHLKQKTMIYKMNSKIEIKQQSNMSLRDLTCNTTWIVPMLQIGFTYACSFDDTCM